jgi:biotin carboxyl carrier protein
MKARDNAPFLEELLKPYHSSPNKVIQGAISEIDGDRVRAPMAGRCWKISVEEGREVKKGEVLVSSQTQLLGSSIH